MKISLLLPNWLTLAMLLLPAAVAAQQLIHLGEVVSFSAQIPPAAPASGKWILEKNLPADVELVDFQQKKTDLVVQLRSFRIDSLQQFELFFALLQGRDTFRLKAISPQYRFVSTLTPEFRGYEGILYWHPIAIPIRWDRWAVALGITLSALVVLAAAFRRPLRLLWKQYRQKLAAKARVRNFDKLLQQKFPEKIIAVNSFWKKELSSLLNVPFQSLTAQELMYWRNFDIAEREKLVQLLELEERFVYAGVAADSATFNENCQVVRRLLGVTEQGRARSRPKDDTCLSA